MNRMVVFTDHVKDKLLREIGKLGITEHVITEILRTPDELLYDASRNRFVAVDWTRNVAVIYEKTDDDLLVITVIYSSELKDVVNRRRRTGTWI